MSTCECIIYMFPHVSSSHTAYGRVNLQLTESSKTHCMSILKSWLSGSSGEDVETK